MASRRKTTVTVIFVFLLVVIQAFADEMLVAKEDTSSDAHTEKEDEKVVANSGVQGEQLFKENHVQIDEHQRQSSPAVKEVQEQNSKSEISKDENDQDKNANELADKMESNDKTKTDIDAKIDLDSKNQSYFSIGSILHSIVDPVLNEFQETKKDSKVNIENKTVSDSINQTNISLQSDISENATEIREIEITNTSKPEKRTKFHCFGRNITNVTEIEKLEVKIVNNTALLSMLNFDRNESSDCILVMFFAPWCHFCAETAPSYNALARAFPQLDVVAVDAAQFSNLNARFGTVSVPNILLFHNSKAVVRFNQTDRSFENLSMFVKNITGLVPNTTLNVTDEDYLGPLPSIPTQDADYLLWVAWMFVIICSSFMFVQSSYGQHWINRVKILWQEHQHID